MSRNGNGKVEEICRFCHTEAPPFTNEVAENGRMVKKLTCSSCKRFLGCAPPTISSSEHFRRDEELFDDD